MASYRESTKAGANPFYSAAISRMKYSMQPGADEIDELLEREDLTHADKEAAFGGNALRFYRSAPGAR